MLTQAREASTETVHAGVLEQLRIKNNEYYLDKTTGKYSGTLIEYLQNEKNVIEQVTGIEGYVVKTVELMGGKQKYGNGTDGKTDVYKIEESASSVAKLQKVASTGKLQLAEEGTENKIYNVYYCASADSKKLLGTLNEQTTSTGTGTLTPPKTYEYSFDAGENIVGYAVKNSDSDDYDLYFIGEGEIYKNHWWNAPFIDASNYACSGATNAWKIDIRNVTLSEGITTIPENAFKNTTITNITLPSTLVRIEDGVFSGCTQLSEIHIPRSVEYVGWYEFEGWQSTQNIYIEGYTEEPENGMPDGWGEHWKDNCDAQIHWVE